MKLIFKLCWRYLCRQKKTIAHSIQKKVRFLHDFFEIGVIRRNADFRKSETQDEHEVTRHRLQIAIPRHSIRDCIGIPRRFKGTLIGIPRYSKGILIGISIHLNRDSKAFQRHFNRYTKGFIIGIPRHSEGLSIGIPRDSDEFSQGTHGIPKAS